MMRRGEIQDALDVYVPGVNSVDSPGRITVHTGESPGSTVTLETRQTDIFECLP